MIDKVTVIGGGCRATALVKIFSEASAWTAWLVRDSKTASYIRLTNYNPHYHGFATLPKP